MLCQLLTAAIFSIVSNTDCETEVVDAYRNDLCLGLFRKSNELLKPDTVQHFFLFAFALAKSTWARPPYNV